LRALRRITVETGDNLDALMVRYQAGDFAAARALIEMVSPRLLRLFLAQRTSRPDADDLLQETWLRIHKVRHTFRPGESAMGWFFAIARHVRVDHYRRVWRNRAREAHLDEFPDTPAAAPFDAEDALEALLAPLPDSQREVIEMLKISGMSLEEVARATSSSVGAVKQKAHRAYRTLRRALSSLGFKKGSTRGVP
jgi:RNA polymerase sigma-70 factor (ECF subfamily)